MKTTKEYLEEPNKVLKKNNMKEPIEKQKKNLLEPIQMERQLLTQ